MKSCAFPSRSNSTTGRRKTPVVVIERPKGFDGPVVANPFASRDRIARMVGARPGGFSTRAMRLTPSPA
jgi:3-polyprenyl-4-hydroxybenzoate decarboxylase